MYDTNSAINTEWEHLGILAATTNSSNQNSAATSGSVTMTSTPTMSSSTAVRASRRPVQASLSQCMAKATGQSEKSKLDEELAKMIALDYRPLSIVEDKGFRSFTHALNPLYVLPSRKTLSQSLIPQLYIKTRAALQQRIDRASAVCLTTDCWTSTAATCSYMAISCHFVEDYKMLSCVLDCFNFTERHTADNLAEELLRIAREWQVEGKVVACVSDNASNVVLAIHKAGWLNMPCLAHNLNYIVKDGLEKIRPTQEKVKAIVEFFHRSTLAAEKLRATQRQMNLQELRLKQDCQTRWSSTYYMFNRFLEVKDAIIATLALLDARIDSLTEEEWTVVQQACEVLKPFEQVTAEMSAESYVTASKVIIFAEALQRITANLPTDYCEQVQDLAQTMSASMAQRFHGMEFNSIYSEAAALDPRFKKQAFDDARAADEAFERIAGAAERVTLALQTEAAEQQVAREMAAQTPQETSSIWSFLDEMVSEDLARRHSPVDAILEVQSYLDEPLFPRTADPLVWWKSRSTLYPCLAKLMMTRLCVTATSVPSERIFSKAGQIITERRNRLGPAKVKQLVFLNANLPLNLI